jgi:hypothetical protein
MSNISHMIVGNTLTCIINGKVRMLNHDNAQFKDIVAELNETYPDPDKLLRLFSLAEEVREYVEGDMEVKGSIVHYKGKPVNNRITDEIIRFMADGLPYKPLIRFLERLMKNSSMRSQQTLYDFLQHECLQITSDGMFMAYKGVRTDYRDIHSGKFCNKPGFCPPRLDPSEVDDDPSRGCSYGYHVGSYAYASGFGPIVMRVLVDPADVRCVPYDCGHQKVRCCFYRVLDEVKPEDMGGEIKRCEDWKKHVNDQVMSNATWSAPPDVYDVLDELMDVNEDPDVLYQNLLAEVNDEDIVWELLEKLQYAFENNRHPDEVKYDWEREDVFLEDYIDYFSSGINQWFNREERITDALAEMCDNAGKALDAIRDLLLDGRTNWWSEDKAVELESAIMEGDFTDWFKTGILPLVAQYVTQEFCEDYDLIRIVRGDKVALVTRDEI